MYMYVYYVAISRRGSRHVPVLGQQKRRGGKRGRPHFTKNYNWKLVDIAWFTCPSPSVKKLTRWCVAKRNRNTNPQRAPHNH